MSLSFASEENCCNHIDAICSVHSLRDIAQHNKYLEEQSKLVQDPRAILEYANFKPNKIKIKGLPVKYIYELVDEMLEDLGVDGLVDYLAINFPDVADELNEKLSARLILDELAKEEQT